MAENDLSINNVLGEDEVKDLFASTGGSTEQVKEPKTEPNKEETKGETQPPKPVEKEVKEETTEVDPDDLSVEDIFDTKGAKGKPESVGSGAKDSIIKDKGNITSEKEIGTSPETKGNNFYSSIAKALKDDGVFPELDDEALKNIKEPEDFNDMVNDVIRSKMDDRLKRINDALTAGVQPDMVQKYENTIKTLESVTDDRIEDETETGVELRKQLIYQDFINKGFSEDRAKKEVKKSLDAGTDVEDAKDAISNNREFFGSKYQALIDEAESQVETEKESRKQMAEELHKSIFEDDKLLGEVKVDKTTRQKIYDNISKPVYRDEKTGEMFTAIQKYERENRGNFIKNIGIIFTLTDGFKNLDGLVGEKVKQATTKNLRELEHTLNSTSRGTDGSLNYASGAPSDDTESYLGKGFKFDVPETKYIK